MVFVLYCCPNYMPGSELPAELQHSKLLYGTALGASISLLANSHPKDGRLLVEKAAHVCVFVYVCVYASGTKGTR